MKRLFVTMTGVIALAGAVLLTGCVHNYGSTSRPYYTSSTVTHRAHNSGSREHHRHHDGGRREHHHDHDGDHHHGSGHR